MFLEQMKNNCLFSKISSFEILFRIQVQRTFFSNNLHVCDLQQLVWCCWKTTSRHCSLSNNRQHDTANIFWHVAASTFLCKDSNAIGFEMYDHCETFTSISSLSTWKMEAPLFESQIETLNCFQKANDMIQFCNFLKIKFNSLIIFFIEPTSLLVDFSRSVTFDQLTQSRQWVLENLLLGYQTSITSVNRDST